MGWATLPAPGKVVEMGYGETLHEEQIGPCVGDCMHIDCAETRATAAAICKHCGQSIGYETPFYVDPTHLVGQFVHARCEHAHVAAARAVAQVS